MERRPLLIMEHHRVTVRHRESPRDRAPSRPLPRPPDWTGSADLRSEPDTADNTKARTESDLKSMLSGDQPYVERQDGNGSEMSKYIATELRKLVLEMAYAGSSVHIGCAFSIIDILAVLYRNHLRYPDNDPEAITRDYLVLSKGHGVMAQYACLYEKRWLSRDDLRNYFGDGTTLKGLSDAHVKGCEVTSGSLGHGLSVAVGMALAAKLINTDQKCYVVVGDGEMNEGPIWEAMLFACHNKLDNLIIIVDVNGYQGLGKTAEILDLGNFQQKFVAFGFETISVDGHSECEIDQALEKLKQGNNGMPKAIIANTVKGKGVSFMEKDNAWHYARLTEETFGLAMAELEKVT